MNIESSEPDEDDTIHIFSPLNVTSTGTFCNVVSFKLFNKNNYINDFRAYFTAESDPEFSVTPKNGELCALNAGPQTF